MQVQIYPPQFILPFVSKLGKRFNTIPTSRYFQLSIYFVIPLLQVSSINRVLRNLASSKEQSAHHLSAATADSVYDKLRMFNGQAAAAAGWAWYGAAAGGPTSHLGLGGHHNPTSHPALTSHQFGGSVGSNGGSSGDRESADEKKHHLSGKPLRILSFTFSFLLLRKPFCKFLQGIMMKIVGVYMKPYIIDIDIIWRVSS